MLLNLELPQLPNLNCLMKPLMQTFYKLLFLNLQCVMRALVITFCKLLFKDLVELIFNLIRGSGNKLEIILLQKLKMQ